MKIWNLYKGGGRGQTPNPNFFAINFGSTEKTFWGRSRAIDRLRRVPQFYEDNRLRTRGHCSEAPQFHCLNEAATNRLPQLVLYNEPSSMKLPH